MASRIISEDEKGSRIDENVRIESVVIAIYWGRMDTKLPGLTVSGVHVKFCLWLRL